MFHGRKKEAQTPMTEEEQKQNEAKLTMILQINKAILAKKAKQEYDAASLAQTEKFAMIAPDFLTLWNYRRDILAAILSDSDLTAKTALVGKELEFLIKSIKRSPKSYTLWYHRQWIIELGLVYERDLLGTQNTGEWKSKILEMELQLCNKMLQLDERNFHCWNYRLWVVQLYQQEIPHRLAEGAREVIKAFLQTECDTAEGLIRKNFANFSAWHYRGKLMPTIYSDVPDEVLMIPLAKIKSDLDLLQHALFTDPKDQSSWNYHEWLISLLLPIQIVAISGEKNGDRIVLRVGLSHKVRDFDKLRITLVADGAPVEPVVTSSLNSFGAP